MTKLFGIIFIAIILAGCVAKGPVFTQLETPATSKAKLYLLRQAAFAGGAYCPSLKYNGEGVGCLKNSGYLVIDVSPGQVLINGGDVELSFEARAGVTYFFEYVTSGQISGGYGVYSSDMVWVSKEYAMSILPELKLSL